MQTANSAVGVGEKGKFNVRMTGRKIYVRKCTTPNPEGIILTDITRDRSNWCEVLACGPECVEGLEPGDMVFVKEVAVDNRQWVNPLGAPFEAIVEEQNIEFVVKQKDGVYG
jgi:hypothetical protein